MDISQSLIIYLGHYNIGSQKHVYMSYTGCRTKFLLSCEIKSLLFRLSSWTGLVKSLRSKKIKLQKLFNQGTW